MAKKASKAAGSLPYRIARTAVWMIVVPAVLVATAIRGGKATKESSHTNHHR